MIEIPFNTILNHYSSYLKLDQFHEVYHNILKDLEQSNNVSIVDPYLFIGNVGENNDGAELNFG